MCRGRSRRGWFFLRIPFMLAFVFLMSLFLMLLWNWLIPEIFIGMKAISYVQALGLLILSKLLFSGIGRRGFHPGYPGGYYHWRKRYEKDSDAPDTETTGA